MTERDECLFLPGLVDPPEPEQRELRRLPFPILALFAKRDRHGRPPGLLPDPAVKLLARQVAIDLEVVVDLVELRDVHPTISSSVTPSTRWVRTRTATSREVPSRSIRSFSSSPTSNRNGDRAST